MALDPTDRRPKYVQIAEVWRREIQEGRVKPGEHIPSARLMVERYTVSQETALKAIRTLVDAGLVESIPSLGTVVLERPKIVQWSASYVTEAAGRPLATWRTNIAEAGHLGEQEIISVARVVAPDDIAERLELAEADLVVVRRRIMLVNRVPYQLADSYFPASIAGGTRLERPTPIAGGSIAALQALGYAPTRHLEELAFHPATPEEQRQLRLGQSVWVVRALRTTFAGDAPVEVSDMALAADRHELRYEFPARMAADAENPAPDGS